MQDEHSLIKHVKKAYTILLDFLVVKKSVLCFVGNSKDIQLSNMIQ